MSRGRLFLGVDGGQSSTKAVIGDAGGKVLARGRAGPVDHASGRAGRAKLQSAIAAVVADALAAAGLPSATGFAAACFGLSGGPARQRGLLSEVVRAGRVRVVNDAEAALEGAAPGAAGAVVIAGTGCIALAKDGAGRTFRCAGWGYLFGDESGAFGIVRSALRRALAAEEGWGRPTSLGQVFRAAAGAGSVNEAMHSFYGPGWPRSRIAGLAPAVDAAAEEGDGCAASVLQAAGRALGDFAITATGLLPPADCSVPVHFSGGAFHSSRVLESFKERCEEGGCAVAPPAHDGAVGALLLAYGSAGLAVPGQGLG